MSSVVTVKFEGRASQFNVVNPSDHIQGFHARGEYYELRQLIAQRDLIPFKSTVLDIGTNVGNHTIFYAKHSWASIVYVFEPNPLAREILESNIASNPDCSAKIQQTYARFGVGQVSGRFRIVAGQANNLGGTRLAPAAAGDPASVDCIRVDDLDLVGHVSFLKIDVEGMEMDVLAGAEVTIAKFRPVLAVEIGSRQEPEFWAWTVQNRYRVIGAFFDYLHFKNYVLIPEG